MSDAEGKLALWLLRLQECDLDVVYRQGILNRTAEALSCLDYDAAEPTVLEDEIPTLPVIASNRENERQGGIPSNPAPTPATGVRSP